MNFERVGTGQPLLMVHGLGGPILEPGTRFFRLKRLEGAYLGRPTRSCRFNSR
jgi:hypothetical protein